MSSGRIKAYFLRVNEETEFPYQGYLGEIDNTLSAKQKYVNFDRPGGTIQVVHLNEEIDIICHDEGKIWNFPANRAWLEDNGQVLDLLVGNVLVVRHTGEEFSSIYESDIPYIERHLVPTLLGEGNTLMLLPPAVLPKYEEEV